MASTPAVSKLHSYGSIGEPEARALISPSPCSSDAPTIDQNKTLAAMAPPSLSEAATVAEVKRANQCRFAPSAIRWCSIVLFGGCLFMAGEFPIHNEEITQQNTFPTGYRVTNKTNLVSNTPLSTLHPVDDLGMREFVRPLESSPALLLTESYDGTNSQNPFRSFPTNAWYQNLLMLQDDEEPQAIHRAYSIPYIIDAAGPIAGLQVHGIRVGASTRLVQLDVQHSLTLGAVPAPPQPSRKNEQRGDTSSISSRYSVVAMTPLGLTLAWADGRMRSTIAYGMPYMTMEYTTPFSTTQESSILPAIASELPLEGKVKLDGRSSNLCQHKQHWFGKHEFQVARELEFTLVDDSTWLVFVSAPVRVQCVLRANRSIEIRVVRFDSAIANTDLVIRAALVDLLQQEEPMGDTGSVKSDQYMEYLRQHASVYPGPHSTVDYQIDQETSLLTLHFDWDARMIDALSPSAAAKDSPQLVTFALSHHKDTMVVNDDNSTRESNYCAKSMVGPTCLVPGSTWKLQFDIPSIGFSAARPPSAWAMPLLSKSLETDIHFVPPLHYRMGAGDTYFSGKMVAKLARVIVIAKELAGLCQEPVSFRYQVACDNSKLPSDETRARSLENLKSSVEIWLNGTAAAPFTFDRAWGGVANCGCDFDAKKGVCSNSYPDCPGYMHPGMNFGNAYYNDMHFHYGYFIYGAAVASHFDPVWGRRMFQNVLLLIRGIANPSSDDPFFAIWRHKDWFRGNSWASGIAKVYLNGKNQESSSEAVAAYEAIALYGKAMSLAWEPTDVENIKAARDVRKLGQALVTTELYAVDYYYHILPAEVTIYPSGYKPYAVGILWQTMAQFQTWFGSAPYQVYGIQLLPLTPISERRDSLEWTKKMFPSFSSTCHNDPACRTGGWSILLSAVVALLGYPKLAASYIETLPDDVFHTSGGNGHSRTNSLWYIATRPELPTKDALSIGNMTEMGTVLQLQQVEASSFASVVDCGQPSLCTQNALNAMSGMYTCRARMDWLIQNRERTEEQACLQVAVVEFPDDCGACNPLLNDVGPFVCPPCSKMECATFRECPHNRQRYFVCTRGASLGGCSSSAWELDTQQCQRCCDLTDCQ